jgi:hypothetical protein
LDQFGSKLIQCLNLIPNIGQTFAQLLAFFSLFPPAFGICGNDLGIGLNSLLNMAKLVAKLLHILPEFVSLLDQLMPTV